MDEYDYRYEQQIESLCADEHIDTADCDGWVPGFIGRVLDQMRPDTDPMGD